MPNGDRTGPNGIGARTGRGMGFCNGFNSPGYANSGFGRGMGRGRGFGRATIYNPRGMLRPRFMGVAPQATPVYGAPVQLTKEQEAEMLEQEAKAIEEEQKELTKELEEVKKRIEELKSNQ